MPASPPPPIDHLARQHWRPTGSVRLRIGWFGRLILEEEHQRSVCSRRAGDAYSPGNWRQEQCWLRAPRGAVLPIDGSAA